MRFPDCPLSPPREKISYPLHAMSLCHCHGCQLVCVALVYSETMSATATSSLVPRLLQYAREKVASAQPAILSNLARVTQLPLIIDVALPGAAYFSVAAGGLCEVLYLLGEEARSITMAKEFMKGSCFVLTMLLEFNQAVCFDDLMLAASSAVLAVKKAKPRGA